MSNKREIQRVDGGDLSALVEALKQRLAGTVGVSADASKLLHSKDGCNGYSADGTVQPATISGNGIVISDLK